jgi:transposase InsO family protein
MDCFSRYILRCDALKETGTELVQMCFKKAFREYGMPLAILMDNGAPFASTSAGGLSRLSVWWVKLGIVPQRIDPGHPEQNPRHERMHRTLKEETASPPQPSFQRQQRAFERFRGEYNYERPHESLGQIPSARVYVPSRREFIERPEDPEYPADYEQRRVQRNGIIRWRSQSLFISTPLRGELVGLKEVDYEQWEVYFGPVLLGTINERQNPLRLRRPRRRSRQTNLKEF